MLRKKLYYALVIWAVFVFTHAEAQNVAAPAMGQDDYAEAVEEEVVETVNLGGEDNVADGGGGVGRAETYEQTVDPESPLNVETSGSDGAEDGVSVNQPEIKPVVPVDNVAEHDPSRVAYARTRKNARTMSLTIPGPRGLITDRNGEVLATSEVAYQPTIDFGQLAKDDDASVLAVARKVMADYEAAGLKVSEKTDAQLLSHYRHRRWIPLSVGPVVRAHELEKIKEKAEAVAHGRLMPLYIRKYPGGESAGHIIGYTGVKAKLPTGPINHNDPIFERQEGRAGLEQKFNKQLTGRPGLWRLMFDENGRKILDEHQVKPRPGGTVVTTLNLAWQKAAEESLRRNTLGRGAFVMVDVQTGEVLVMASVPNFDPNTFIPAISQKDYDALRNDENNPLVSRAFAGVYPPASTFKTITVAAGLHLGIIGEDTYINCPYSIRIGGHPFRNHSKFTGSINCITALSVSNNPFMYQIAATREPRIGAERLCAYARRFGYGSTTGLPIADKAGNVPDESWMYRNYSRGFMQGDAANMSIGQGPLLATPLQVAHAMAGIANGRYLPKLHLVRQMLDIDGNVVYQFNPMVESNLRDMSDALAVVRRGMRAVVYNGSGRRAALSYTDNAGKTGTAQWGRPSDDCRLAWFAGFLPADNPRYAYAALYEGKPHQRISGGRMAAAIVKSFFENIKPDMEQALKAPSRALDGSVGETPMTEEERFAAEAEAAANQQRKIDEARRRKEAERRHRQSGWDDGRSRH
ncbi:MAG: hypothetical protein IKZ07_01630 [Akkermansia sp.]|nr:hypothetical protein [Akkermansia sp.]